MASPLDLIASIISNQLGLELSSEDAKESGIFLFHSETSSKTQKMEDIKPTIR